MNFAQFLNKKVLNKQNEKGVITSFDDEHITIKYSTFEKTYNPKITFTNGYLSLVNSKDNQQVKNYYLDQQHQDEQHEQFVKDVYTKTINKRNKINQTFKRLFFKNLKLKSLFGEDFVYKPYIEFVIKYQDFIDVSVRSFEHFVQSFRQKW